MYKLTLISKSSLTITITRVQRRTAEAESSVEFQGLAGEPNLTLCLFYTNINIHTREILSCLDISLAVGGSKTPYNTNYPFQVGPLVGHVHTYICLSWGPNFSPNPLS